MMKTNITFSKLLLISYLLVLSSNLIAQNISPFQFISPRPTSVMVSNVTNIILQHSGIIDQRTLFADLIKVEGSISGVHAGELVLSDDDKTIVFNPFIPFADNEEVSVEVMEGAKTETGGDIPKFSFKFKTAPAGIVQMPDGAVSETGSLMENQDPGVLKENGINAFLPPPPITIDSINNPSEGHIFMATWDRNAPAKYGNFIFILDKGGAIVDSVRVDGAPYDFQIQPNGLLSYALGDFKSFVPLPGEELQHMVLDNTLAVVDSFKMKNGYITDFHEFKMLPNGHVMMMSYHTITYDMSAIVEGGKPDASLVINIIQEQDRNKNVVFEWRNIDYIPITDSDLDLTASRLNYGTLNAFDVDDDGNILASFRNHSEIMKISRATGEVMWRMGGPRSEFTYVGEHEENAPYYHARQHNIRRRPNGNITLFDNGEFHKPPYSRAVEYSLDEENKVATLVSEWRYPNGNIFCATAGNAEHLSNGGWFIGYGVPHPQFVQRNAVEVHPDGSIALELSLPKGVLAYRVTKFPWKESVNKPSITHIEVKEGNTYSFNNDSIITGVEITYNSIVAADYNESTITRLPYGPVEPEFSENIITIYPVSIIYEALAIDTQSAEVRIDLDQYPEIKNPENTTVYYREFPDQGLFIPRSTTYDSIENELVVILSGFGEIVFGVPDNETGNNIPILYAPLDQQKLILQDSIKVQWTGKGMYNSFNVQISTDSTFTLVLHESNTNLSYYSMAGLTNNTQYYWRVNSELDTPGEWSEVWNFEIVDPFIIAVSPNGGEEWAIDSSEIIRWETNILEDVHIHLLQDQNYILSIDTVQGSHQAYQWILPAELQAGENYRIQIVSASDSAVFGLSENVFTIVDSTTSIGESEQGFHGYSLAQNFPNPFNLTTNISYSIQKSNFVTLSVYDLSGKKIHTLISDFQEVGTYSVNFDAHKFSSGIYFYKLEAGKEFVEIKKMLLIRK
jgi:hypothetical protein